MYILCYPCAISVDVSDWTGIKSILIGTFDMFWIYSEEYCKTIGTLAIMYHMKATKHIYINAPHIPLNST